MKFNTGINKNFGRLERALLKK